MIGSGTRLFASTTQRELLCLDINSGKRSWSQALQWSPWECAAIARDRVFVGSTDGSLRALNAQSGYMEWQTNLGAAISTSICSAGKTVYAGTADGRMHHIDMREGGVLSSMKVDAKLKPASLPFVHGDAVLVLLIDEGADYRALASLDHRLSGIRWSRRAPDWWTTTRILVAREAVVLGTKSGEITGYSIKNGEPKWSFSLAGTIRAIGSTDEMLYVGTVEGRLYAVRMP